MSKTDQTENAPDKMIKLTYPIKWGEETISEIGLKRPKGKHIKKLIGQTEEEKVLILASKLSGHPMSVFDEMDMVDIQKVSEAVADFLGNGPSNG